VLSYVAPYLVPPCDVQQIEARGRALHRNAITPEQCAAVRAVNAQDEGFRWAGNGQWGDKLSHTFRSHTVPGWRHTEDSEAARQVVAHVLQLQRKLLNDPTNTYLQSHDITVRSAVNISSPNKWWQTLPWTAGRSPSVLELLGSAQPPRADYCSLYMHGNAAIHLGEPRCQLTESNEGFCCNDRMCTASVYLNQPGEVDGGRFLFWDHDLMDLWRLRTGFCHVKPECGTMVMFPSDGNHIHAVTPVVRGDRSAIMTWYTNVSHAESDALIRIPINQWHDFQEGHPLVPSEGHIGSGVYTIGPATSGFGGEWHSEHGYLQDGLYVDENGQIVSRQEFN